MAEESHTQPVFGEGLKRKLVDWLLASALGFMASWAHSQWTVNDLKNKIIRLEEKESAASRVEEKRADAALNDAREMERLTQAVNNLTIRVQEIRDDQRKR